eukprot:1151196-Pelagomonas_calceolata.AAC.2
MFTGKVPAHASPSAYDLRPLGTNVWDVIKEQLCFTIRQLGSAIKKVQGAQSAAKTYVWVFLMGLHGYLSYAQGGWGFSSLLCALLLGTGGFCLWAGERDY